MIQYLEALKIIEEIGQSREVKIETVSLDSATGRVLAETLLSSEDVPSFLNSAMDGFALCSGQTLKASQKAPVSFSILGSVSAGEWVKLPPSSHSFTGVEIMTGAPVPDDHYDSVVKIEDVKLRRNSSGRVVEIQLFKPLSSGENLRKKGEDFKKGSIVVSKNTELFPEHILALASLGITDLPVRKKPKIAVIASGNELVHYSEKNLVPGKIRNSTTPYLEHAISYLGAEAHIYRQVRDIPSEFIKTIDQARKDGVDIILSTGAVSMGRFDFIYEAIQEAGAQVYFHKAAIRPGKPGLFAEFKDGPVFFGAPGNPISTVIALRFFVAPYLRRLLKLPKELPLQAKLSHSVSKAEGLRCFFKAHVNMTSEGSKALVLPGQASFIVNSLLQANAWAVLPEEGTQVGEGSLIEVYPLYPSGFHLNSSHLPIPCRSEDTHHKGCCV